MFHSANYYLAIIVKLLYLSCAYSETRTSSFTIEEVELKVELEEFDWYELEVTKIIT